MKINRKLNLISTVETEQGLVHVHSMPLSVEVFERYFLVMSKTFSAIYQEGLTVTSGPRVASLMLQRVAKDMGEWETDPSTGVLGVKDGLLGEIHRLTNVLFFKDGAWEMTPYTVAKQEDLLSPEDLRELEGGIVFFILASALHKRTMLPGVLNSMCGLWGLATTSSNITEYRDYLKTSMKEDSSGMTPTQGQPVTVPSSVAY